jgi:hypothetical protein
MIMPWILMGLLLILYIWIFYREMRWCKVYGIFLRKWYNFSSINQLSLIWILYYMHRKGDKFKIYERCWILLYFLSSCSLFTYNRLKLKLTLTSKISISLPFFSFICLIIFIHTSIIKWTPYLFLQTQVIE